MTSIMIHGNTHLTLDQALQQLEATQEENRLLKQKLAQHRHEIRLLCRCTTFEILTREGLEMQWAQIKHTYPSYSILFFDLDRLKQLNAKYGMMGANKKIHTALNCVRSSELIGRAFMGDEIVCICKSHLANKVCSRIVAGFQEQGIGVTTAIGQCMSESLAECLEPLIAQVETKKERRNA